jgi:LysR family nitrogen assimilation transcriptional regulator
VADLPLALPSREHGLRIAVEQFMQSIGRVPIVHTELESIVGLKQIAQQGGVCTILPRGEMEDELKAGRLGIVRVVNPTIFRTLFVAWSSERPYTANMKAVLRIARRETAGLISQGSWGSKYLG